MLKSNCKKENNQANLLSVPIKIKMKRKKIIMNQMKQRYLKTYIIIEM